MKPVSLVVPFAAGGTTDTEARLYTQKLQEATGQPWVFDFRPVASSPDVFRKRLAGELARWRKVIREKVIRLEEPG